MKDITVEHNGRRYSMILRRPIFKPGPEWVSKDEDGVQVGLMNYNTGHHLRAHVHNTYERVATRSCEAMFIRSGALRVTVFDEKGEDLGQFLLREGDIYISLLGGHTFDILEDGTQMFEVKNGPFFGVEKDKTWLEPLSS